MKKVYFLLVIVIIISLITGCSNNVSLRQSIKYGEKISQEIQTLYKKKSQELIANTDSFIAWRKQISNAPINTTYTIERNKEGKWQYYTENYERILFQWEDNHLEEIMSSLFNEHNVEKIIINDDSIRYYISEDALIYSINNVETDTFTVHIEGNWYHFKFPYGI